MSGQTLNILVEGITESVIIADFLRPYWQKRFTSCVIHGLKGSGNVKTKYMRESERILSKPDQAVLVLIDIKSDPFGVRSSTSTHADAYQTLQTLLYNGAGRSESDVFGIFPVVIEPETWLLADPTIQKTYLKKAHTHPENEPDPAGIIDRKVKGYYKGVGAKKIFAKASAEAVYADNCPHFVFLADWIATGKATMPGERPTGGVSPDILQKLEALQAQYDDLSKSIDTYTARGQTLAAGLRLTERYYIEQQIRDALQQSPDDASA